MPAPVRIRTTPGACPCLIRNAAAHRVPIWTVSRGKNLGYGTAAPVVPGSIVIDLSRMQNIAIDVENATVLLEPAERQGAGEVFNPSTRGVSKWDLD